MAFTLQMFWQKTPASAIEPFLDPLTLPKPHKGFVSTSYVEKHNQTMRQCMKRFSRLTAGHSKKIDNHVHMVALYTCWYNFARVNSAVRMSPAMACGLEQRLWDVADIVKLVEEWENEAHLVATPQPR